MATESSQILRVNRDLTLVVGQQKERILVSRDVVVDICKPWEAMLTRFIEASKSEVELPDDDPTAVTIVCTIAHLKFHDLPLTLTINELSGLATLCDKYDTIAMVGPFIHDCVTPWFFGAANKLEDKYLDDGNEKFVWIGWVFGYVSEFCTLTDALRRRVSVNEKGQCVYNGGLVVLDDIQMPPDIVDNLFEIRENCIRDLLEICYSYIDKVVDGKMVCRATSTAKQEKCFAITFGSCVWGFHSLGLNKPEKTSADIYESVNEFCTKLSGLKIHTLPGKNRAANDIHEHCNFRPEMKGKWASVIHNLPSAYHDSHQERIQENWKKADRTHGLN